jgi:hypothetical protein
MQVCTHIRWFSICGSLRSPQKLENQRNKWFISFKTPTMWERAVTWWNPAAQKHTVLDSSSFAPILTLPHRTCLHSASSILAVTLNYQLNFTYLCLLHEYHVIYSVWYYPRFHITTVGLGMYLYYPWIWGHTFIMKTLSSNMLQELVHAR